MIATGTVLLGGTLALGSVVQRSMRRPKVSLATTLLPKAQERPIVTAQRETKRTTRVLNHSRAIALGGVAAGGSALLLAGANGYPPLVLARNLALTLQHSRYGPLLYIAVDTIRPLTFFPDSLMTLMSGLIFGPVQGFVISYIGFVTSALLAYSVGRALRQDGATTKSAATIEPEPPADPTEDAFAGYAQIRPLFTRFGSKMQDQPFISMILLHGMFLHADTVNGLAGYLGLGVRPFLAGAMIGVLPAMAANVLAGASFHGAVTTGVLHFNPLLLTTGGVLLAGSLGIAWYLQTRDKSTSSTRPLGEEQLS